MHPDQDCQSRAQDLHQRPKDEETANVTRALRAPQILIL